MKKINLAKDLLKSGTTPQDVSEECSFSTYSNFYKTFVERIGVSPRIYVIFYLRYIVQAKLYAACHKPSQKP